MTTGLYRRMNNPFNYPITYRFIIAIVLAAITLGLILIRPSAPAEQSHDWKQGIKAFTDSMDRGIDTLYKHFGIEIKNIRRKEINLKDLMLPRREHRVLTPAGFIAILFNQELNIQAERFGGRAYGSENSKSKITTLHVKFGEYITHSIILQPPRELVQKSARTKKRK